MSQTTHHHDIRSFNAVHHAMKTIQSSGIIAAQISSQGFKAMAVMQGVFVQLMIDLFEVGFQMGITFADGFDVALCRRGVQNRPRHFIWSRVFILLRGSFLLARIFSMIAGWLAIWRVSVIAFHSSSDTNIAECRRPIICTGPLSVTSSINGWSRARAWLAGIASRVLMRALYQKSYHEQPPG